MSSSDARWSSLRWFLRESWFTRLTLLAAVCGRTSPDNTIYCGEFQVKVDMVMEWVALSSSSSSRAARILGKVPAFFQMIAGMDSDCDCDCDCYPPLSVV